MNQAGIFYPMAALALLTTLMLLLIAARRFQAAGAGQVTPADFRLGESAKVPPTVSLPNRNYMNLLELPVLFYVVCLALYATQTVDALAINLAWAYFALRLAHSAVHLLYNNVMHRLVVFALSNFALLGLWIKLLMALPRS